MGLETHNARERFGVIVYRTLQRATTRLSAETPVDAVVIAIEYLRQGYHVLLTDATVAALAEQDGRVDLEWVGKLRAAPPSMAELRVPFVAPGTNGHGAKARSAVR
jgi:hypothetical protein